MSQSKASIVASWPAEKRRKWYGSLDPKVAESLTWDWRFWGRPEQQMPAGDWRTALWLAGRGFGKSRTGAELTHQFARTAETRGYLVARTAADVRDVMIEGDSGIMSCGDPAFRPTYEPSKRRLTWPNGSTATCFSAEKPDQMRGPQGHWAWCDEICAWQYTDAFDQMQLGLRLGSHPRCLVTTTPRPTKLLRDLLKDPSTAVIRGTTYDNAENIDIRAIVQRYAGTTLGRQELLAEILDDAPGAMWTRAVLDSNKVRTHPDLARIVIGVDPAVSVGPDSDETGIVAVGRAGGRVQDMYVLADRSGRLKPDAWARRAVELYHQLEADCIIAESNNGGDMVEHTIRTVDKSVHVRQVKATRGKATRAEPIAALYEQGRIHHLGELAELTDQMCTWQPGVDAKSPDRVDALVWACTALMTTTQTTGFRIPGGTSPNSISGL